MTIEQSLDLRFNGKINSDVSPVFNTVSYRLRSEFNNFVSEISQSHKENLEWWLQGPAGRNTFSSPFFHYYCTFYLIKELVEEKKFIYRKLLVDSKEFALVVSQVLNDLSVTQCEVIVASDYGVSVKIKEFLKLPLLFFKKIIQHVIAKITAIAKVTQFGNKELVLIDTFMITGFTENDRWYGTLWDELTDKLKSETFFVPTIVLTPVRKMLSVYKRLRNNKRNFLIKEDYLQFSDYIYAFRYKKRIASFTLENISVLGYSFTDVLQHEIDTTRDVLTIIESILTVRFVKRLNESGIKVRLAIDWFEGQAIDKAWNYGFNTIYPETKTVGYRAFESFPFYLCSYPLQIEKESNVLPDVMAVQGKGTISTVREFLPDLKVMVIPSFKSQHVWQYDFDKKLKPECSVLITFPISLKGALRIMRRVLESYEELKLELRSVRFTIKPHPTHSTQEVRAVLSGMPDVFVISDENSFATLLHKSDLLITEASSTCLEALACGIPVIIIENEEGLTFDPVPLSISATMVRRVRTLEQLIVAMPYYLNLSDEDWNEYKNLGKKIRADYFEPLSKEGVERFLNIETGDKVGYA